MVIEEIEKLIKNPRESLSVEIKNWVDLDNPRHQAKIIKTLLALRNYNGGLMIFGFNDVTLDQEPDAPENIEALFHTDKIQSWITKFSSESFEVGFVFPERDGIKHPVLIVPAGVKTIVASKADLFDDSSGQKLINANEVYVRSLHANNTPSTTKATSKDWNNIIEICFDNREADIGNFLRRHLSGLNIEEIITALGESSIRKEDEVDEFYSYSLSRYHEVVSERNLELPPHGSWSCAMVVAGEIPEFRPNEEFLRMIYSNNPQYTGWPVWLDSRGFKDNSHPYLYNKAWEAMVVSLERGWGDQIDFFRFDPTGKFFLIRALEDDIGGGDNQPKPLAELDFGLAILRTAETIAVGISIAKAMGCKPEETTLTFKFAWNGLNGRELSSWANRGRFVSIDRKAYQDEVQITIDIPLDIPSSRISEFVKKVIDPLFELFDGFEISQSVVDDLTNRLLERRL